MLTIVSEQALFEIGLPGVRLTGLLQCGRVCDRSVFIIAFLAGCSVGQLTARVHVASLVHRHAVCYPKRQRTVG